MNPSTLTPVERHLTLLALRRAMADSELWTAAEMAALRQLHRRLRNESGEGDSI